MTTNRIEAARLTEAEIVDAILHVDSALGNNAVDRAIADAATAKALRIEDARRKALVEALRESRRYFQGISPLSRADAIDLIDTALKQEEAS